REHPRLTAGAARTDDRLIGRRHEHAGMAVEHGTDLLAGGDRGHDALGHLRVAARARLPFLEAVAERRRVRIELLNPRFSGRIGEQVKDVPGAPDRIEGLGRRVTTEHQANPDPHERPWPVAAVLWCPRAARTHE